MSASAAPRVLVLGSVLGQPMGGVRRHAEQCLPRAAKLLEERGGRMLVLCAPEGLPFELPASVELLRAPLHASPPWRRALDERRALRELRARYELVHGAHLPLCHADAPCVYLAHDVKVLDEAPRWKRALFAPVLGAALRASTRVACVSAHVEQRLQQAFALPPERFARIPNGCDHLALEPRRAGPGAPIACVAHLEPRKNQALLLRALALDAALPELWLVGAARGREGERLRGLARELGVAERVRWCGLLGDAELGALYARIGCLAAPSLVEGFGIPVLEAQRAGAPVAVARSAALPEVAGAAAPSFDPHSAEECARALHAALASPPERLEAARVRAAGFRWQHTAELLVDVWCEAWSEARAGRAAGARS